MIIYYIITYIQTASLLTMQTYSRPQAVETGLCQCREADSISQSAEASTDWCAPIVQNTLVELEIRSVELGVCPMQLFHFWSCDVHPVQNLLLCTKFNWNWMIFHWDMAIYRFSKWRPPSWNCLPPYETTHKVWPQLSVKFHVNLIHRSEDIAIWIVRIFGLKCLFRPPKLEFWGTLDP